MEGIAQALKVKQEHIEYITNKYYISVQKALDILRLSDDNAYRIETAYDYPGSPQCNVLAMRFYSVELDVLYLFDKLAQYEIEIANLKTRIAILEGKMNE